MASNRRRDGSTPLDELCAAALAFAADTAGIDRLKSDRLAQACRDYAHWVASNTNSVQRDSAIRRWISSVVARVTTGDVIAWQLAKLVKDGKYHVATLFPDGSSTVAIGDTIPEAVANYERMLTEPQRPRRPQSEKGETDT